MEDVAANGEKPTVKGDSNAEIENSKTMDDNRDRGKAESNFQNDNSNTVSENSNSANNGSNMENASSETISGKRCINGRSKSMATDTGLDHETVKDGLDHVTVKDGLDHDTVKDGLDHVTVKDGLDHVTVKDGLDHDTVKDGLDHVTVKDGLHNVAIKDGLDHVTVKDGLDHVTVEDGLDHVTMKDGLDHVTVKDGLDHVTVKDGLDHNTLKDGLHHVNVEDTLDHVALKDRLDHVTVKDGMDHITLPAGEPNGSTNPDHEDVHKDTVDMAKATTTNKTHQTDDGGGMTTKQNNQGSFEQILYGHCKFCDLPPLPKKVVRIFISSTFTDTKEERNALMTHVYPRLSDYCRDKHGLQFQVMDMRWGVPEQASDNHSTSDLCIQEIRKCQQLSVGPNFVALVGNKYGYRPIPSDIREATFVELARGYSSPMETANQNWSTVTDWYKKDENAIPPVYLLQPISSKIQHYNEMENQTLRKKAQEEWNEVNKTLTRTLREAASLAYNRKAISEEEKDTFFISVTENEITEGVVNSQLDPSETSFCVIRKIDDIGDHSHHPKVYRFADVTSEATVDSEAQELLERMQDAKIEKKLPSSNLLKIDIEWKISGANISVENLKDLKSSNESGGHQILPDEKSDDVKMKHYEYLENVCSNFFTTIRKLIDEGIERQATKYKMETQEILQHWHLAKTRCEIFEGRDAELQRIQLLLAKPTQSSPIVVHGCSGCGKTSVMSKIVEYLGEGKWLSNGKPFLLIPRFLGTTPNTSNLHQLLVSICQQLAFVFRVTWNEPEKFRDLVESFHSLLRQSTPESSVVILLDSIDQLMPAYNAFKMTWLPQTLPEHVKCIVSTIDEGYPIIKSLNDRYGKEHDILLNPLGEKLGLEIISRWLKGDRRKMTEQQKQITMQALSKCSLPLYARIAYDQIKRWKSHTVPSASELEPTVQGTINKLFASVEEKFGTVVVKHMVSYFTASRQGISEPELEHMLSLDDTFLNHVFQLWNPPVRRVPPLLWTRIRTELHSYIVERSSDDTLVLNWYHRQFIETAKKRYLSDKDFARHIHDHMVQYFSGKWGGGKEKPFQYTEGQRKRFGLDTCRDAKDRKVPQQPYSFGNSQGDIELRFNKRKLSELPFHLIKCKEYKRLKLDVFFNYDWLSAKLMSSSIQQVLEEFEIFMQADKQLKKDNDMVVLFSNMQLLRPFVHVFSKSLAFELTGRLSQFVDQSEYIACLLKSCDSIGANHCPILPVLSLFESAEKGFSHNIQYRTTDSWVEGGAICASRDFRTLYIMDYTEDGLPVLHVYDLVTGEQVTQLDVMKVYQGTIDMYTKLHLSRSGKEMFAFYRQKSEGQVEKKFRDKYALIDVINVENGEVLKTIEAIMPGRELKNALMYTTENFLCVDFREKVPLINFKSDVRKDLNRPTFMSESEKYWIVCGRESTQLKQFVNKCLLGQFDVTNPQKAVGGAHDFSVIIMVESGSYTITIYELMNKLHQYKDIVVSEPQTTIIKSKAAFPLTDKKIIKLISDVFTAGGADPEDRLRGKIGICLSPKKDYFMVTYQRREWFSIMYGLNASAWTVKCHGVVCSSIPPTENYPVFNSDGTKVVYSLGKKVTVVSSETCQVIQSIDLSEAVKDFTVSEVSEKVAVMLSKSVLLLTMNSNLISDSQEESALQESKRSVAARESYCSNVLIPRTVSDTFSQSEVVAVPQNGKLVLEEVKDLCSYADTDRIASARSKKKRALVSFFSPNGLRTIQFHRKVQVIDTKVNEIKYTPRKGDVLVRSVNKNGAVINENITIPGLSEAEANMGVDFCMNQGDRVMGENGKVRFRVNQEPDGQYRIRNIPSVLTVYSVDELKLTRLSSIIVYDENIVTIGNDIIVTSRDTQHGHFVNIYSQQDGKLLATHPLEKPCNGAKITNDGVQLFVIDMSLSVYLFVSPTYNSLERKVCRVPPDLELCTVKDMICFDKDRDALLLLYVPKTLDIVVQSNYCHINVLTKQYGAPVAVSSPFDDVSLSGTLAVDSKLQIYDLPTGSLKGMIEYQALRLDGMAGTVADIQLTARFMNESKLVVFLDKRDETLHVASVDDKQVLFSAFYHVPEFNQRSQLYIIKQGILLIKTDSRLLCFALSKYLQDGKTDAQAYTSEKERAFILVSQWVNDPIAGFSGQSMYTRRDLLRQNLQEGLPAIEKSIERNFKAQNPERPQVLVLSDSLLPKYFVPNLFSKFLKTEQLTATSSDVALAKLKSLDKRYDVILLQLITDDVRSFSTDQCVSKISDTVNVAKENSRMVLLSLAPCRADGNDINAKTQQVNAQLEEKYGLVPAVHLVKNDNFSENGRPISKYFQDGVTLSAAGTKQITINYKDVMLPLLGEHYSVGQKKNPKLQSTGNKIL